MPEVLDTPAAGPAALRGSLLRTASYAIAVALSLASAPLLVRHLGVADFGRYVTVLSLMNLVAGVTEGGINAIALREYATAEGGRRAAVMRSLIGLRLVLSVGGAAIGVAFAVAAGYDSPMVVGAIGAGVAVVLQGAQTLLMTPLQAQLRFGWTVVLDLLRHVGAVVLIVIGVLAGAGVVSFLWIMVPVGVVGLVLTALLVRGSTPLLPGGDVGVWRPLLRDTLPFTAAMALNVVYFRIPILVMSLESSTTETGYYATAFRVVEVLLNVPAMLIGAAFPILARAERDDEQRFGYAMTRIFDLGVLFGAWLAMNIVVGATFAVAFLAGGEADPAAPVLRIQGLAFLASFVGVAAAYGLLSLRRHRALLVANAATLAAVLVLALVLVPGGGAVGAAIAALCGEVLLAVILAVVFLRARRIAWRDLVVAPVALAFAALGALSWEATGQPELLGVVMANAVFVVGLVALRRVPPELRDVLR